MFETYNETNLGDVIDYFQLRNIITMLADILRLICDGDLGVKSIMPEHTQYVHTRAVRGFSQS